MAMTLSELFAAILELFAKPQIKQQASSLPEKLSPSQNITEKPISAPSKPAVVATLGAQNWLSLCEPITKYYEKCYLRAYPDPGSPLAKALISAGIWYNYLAQKVDIPSNIKERGLSGAPWTIGFGTTGVGIVEGLVWTQTQADSQLTVRLNQAADAVDRSVKIVLSSAQKAALVDLTYNIGMTAFANSTLLKLLNNDDLNGASGQILVWNKSGGEVSNGLVLRRKTEYDLFTTGSYQL